MIDECRDLLFYAVFMGRSSCPMEVTARSIISSPLRTSIVLSRPAAMLIVCVYVWGQLTGVGVVNPLSTFDIGRVHAQLLHLCLHHDPQVTTTGSFIGGAGRCERTTRLSFGQCKVHPSWKDPLVGDVICHSRLLKSQRKQSVRLPRWIASATCRVFGASAVCIIQISWREFCLPFRLWVFIWRQRPQTRSRVVCRGSNATVMESILQHGKLLPIWNFYSFTLLVYRKESERFSNISAYNVVVLKFLSAKNIFFVMEN